MLPPSMPLPDLHQIDEVNLADDQEMEEFLQALASGACFKTWCTILAPARAGSLFEIWSITTTGQTDVDESSNDSFATDCEFLLSTVFDFPMGPTAVETASWATPQPYNAATLSHSNSQWPPTR
jgi:hypothetical protein